MTWGGWNDDLSGIWKFEYDVHEIEGIPLKEKPPIAEGTIFLNTSVVRSILVNKLNIFLHYLFKISLHLNLNVLLILEYNKIKKTRIVCDSLHRC